MCLCFSKIHTSCCFLGEKYEGPLRDLAQSKVWAYVVSIEAIWTGCLQASFSLLQTGYRSSYRVLLLQTGYCCFKPVIAASNRLSLLQTGYCCFKPVIAAFKPVFVASNRLFPIHGRRNRGGWLHPKKSRWEASPRPNTNLLAMGKISVLDYIAEAPSISIIRVLTVAITNKSTTATPAPINKSVAGVQSFFKSSTWLLWMP